jgi:hypothetical protein
MQNSKILVCDSVKQEAIVYHRQFRQGSLARWNIADEPEKLVECETGRAVLPSLVSWLPHENAIAIVQFNNIWQSQEQGLNVVLELRSPQDFSCIQEIPLPAFSIPPAYLVITPCQQYAIVGGLYGYLNFVDLQKNKVWQIDFQNSECPTTIVFDPQMQFFLNTATDQLSRWELHRINDLKKGQFTRLEEFSGDIRCYYDRIVFDPNADAFAHTWLRAGIHNVVTYRSIQRSGMEEHQARSNASLDHLNPPIAPVLWETQLPYSQPLDGNAEPHYGDIAFLDAQTLVSATGRMLTLLDTATGAIMADYKLSAIVESIAVDSIHQRVIAVTQEGMIAVAIAEFNLKVGNSKTSQNAPHPFFLTTEILLGLNKLNQLKDLICQGIYRW